MTSIWYSFRVLRVTLAFFAAKNTHPNYRLNGENQ